MTNNRWIIMPIEIQKRELDAKLVIACIAVSRGFKVLIGRDRIVRRLARFLPKGIILDKSIGAKGDKKVWRFHRHGHSITAMDEEATGFLVDPAMFLETRLSEESLDMTKRWYCISDSVRKLCIDYFPEYADRFVTVGLARTDTWREPLVQMYQKDADDLKRKYGRFILFNSNFGIPNHARGETFVNKQLKKAAKMYSAGTDPYEQLLAENTANWKEYVKIIPQILKWFPEHKILVRPHPGENVDFWREEYANEPRIITDHTGVVTPWILASEFMLHHACTTGIEANIMKIPQVVYAPYPDIHHDTDMARAFSNFVTTGIELRQFMENAINKGQILEVPPQNKETYFASLQGKLVAEKIVDDLETLCFESKPLPIWLPLLQLAPRHLASVFKDITPRAKAYSNQKFGGTSVEEINEKLLFINAKLGLKNNLEVQRIFQDLYLIE